MGWWVRRCQIWQSWLKTHESVGHLTSACSNIPSHISLQLSIEFNKNRDRKKPSRFKEQKRKRANLLANCFSTQKEVCVSRAPHPLIHSPSDILFSLTVVCGAHSSPHITAHTTLSLSAFPFFNPLVPSSLSQLYSSTLLYFWKKKTTVFNRNKKLNICFVFQQQIRIQIYF